MMEMTRNKERINLNNKTLKNSEELYCCYIKQRRIDQMETLNVKNTLHITNCIGKWITWTNIKYYIIPLLFYRIKYFLSVINTSLLPIVDSKHLMFPDLIKTKLMLSSQIEILFYCLSIFSISILYGDIFTYNRVSYIPLMISSYILIKSIYLIMIYNKCR